MSGVAFRFRSAFQISLLLVAICLLIAVPLGFTGCGNKKSEAPDVIILQTGRLRGNIYPLSLQDIAPLQYYPLLAGKIRSIREEAAAIGAEVLLVDLGDSLDGSFASLATNSENVVRFFNELNYDAVLLGNLDNDISPDVLKTIRATILCPFLGPDGSPAIPGATVAAKLPPTADRKTPVFLVSNFYGDTSKEEFPDRFPSAFGKWTEGVVPDRDAEQALRALGERPKNALTLFAWMKFEAPDSPPEAFLARLREAGVDAILAHRVYGSAELDRWSESSPIDWKPPVSQNILRQNGGFSLARLDLKRSGNGWRVLRQEIIPMTINNAEPDAQIVAVEEELAEKIRSADRTLGQLSEPWGADALLNSMLSAFTTIPTADVVVYSPQSIRAELPKGKLTASRLYSAVPWSAPVVTFEIPKALLPALVAQNTGWRWWAKETNGAPVPSDETITIATSRFFATILRRQSGLSPAPAFTPAAQSEYLFLQDYLSNHSLESPPGKPDGWTDISRESR